MNTMRRLIEVSKATGLTVAATSMKKNCEAGACRDEGDYWEAGDLEKGLCR